jgi:hypothetical protein
VAIVFGLLILPALVYGIIMGLRYALSVPASVVEDLKATAALRRSVVLSKESRGRIFVLWLLVFVIQIALVMTTQGYFFFAAFSHRGELAVGFRILQQFLAFLTNSFIAPILATGITLFYYDQRIRKEGFDIEWMMKAAGMTVPEPPPLPAFAPQPPPAEAQIEPWVGFDAHLPQTAPTIAEGTVSPLPPVDESPVDESPVDEPGDRA